MQLLTGLPFDICYVIKTRIGFKIAEIIRFLNYFSSYSFALKIVINLNIFEDSQEDNYSEVISL